MSTANEIVKEQMIQTTSKKIVRSPEKRKPRAYVPHISYVGIGGFMRATLAIYHIFPNFLISLHKLFEQIFPYQEETNQNSI